MFGIGKKKRNAKGEVLTSTGEYTRRIEESVEVIVSVVKKDIRAFFNHDQNLETLVTKLKNGNILPAMGMMALEPTKENTAKTKLASDKIKLIYEI